MPRKVVGNKVDWTIVLVIGTKFNLEDKTVSFNDEDHLSVNYDQIHFSLVMHGVNCEKYTYELSIKTVKQFAYHDQLRHMALMLSLV